MIDLFGVPWSKVDLATVQRFLDSAGEEGVTWEAKADEDAVSAHRRGGEPGKLGPHTIRKAVSGLANQIGGYFIAGARWDRSKQSWTLPGVTVADVEPELGLSKVIRSLLPVPRFETRVWALDDERTVAVIRVEPVDEPPCMTPQGHVYERVSGETIRVDDPTRLAALLVRGERARARAQQFAERAARRAVDAVEWETPPAARIGVALAPIGRLDDDVGSRLFTRSFREMITAATDQFVVVHPTTSPTRICMTAQDMLSCSVRFDPEYIFLGGGSAHRQHRSEWRMQATWDGAVAASVSFDEDGLWDAPELDALVRAAWDGAAVLVSRLGGYGPGHLNVIIVTHQASWSDALRNAPNRNKDRSDG